MIIHDFGTNLLFTSLLVSPSLILISTTKEGLTWTCLRVLREWYLSFSWCMVWFCKWPMTDQTGSEEKSISWSISWFLSRKFRGINPLFFSPSMYFRFLLLSSFRCPRQSNTQCYDNVIWLFWTLDKRCFEVLFRRTPTHYVECFYFFFVSWLRCKIC